MSEILTDVSERALIHAIEANLWDTFSYFGRVRGGALHDASDLLWFASPIRHIPYNGVLRTRWETDVDRRIDAVIETFRRRNAEFAWIISPSTRPEDLGRRLQARGFALVETLTGMAAPLADLPAEVILPPGVTVTEVRDATGLRDYADLMAWRWHVPPSALDALWEMNVEFGYGPDRPGRRWLAYADGRPVGKAFLHLGAGVAGIYGVAALPDARGRGIGTAVTVAAYHAAREAGYQVGVLHSSPMAVNLYRRLGFTAYCMLTIYAPGRRGQR